MRSNSLNEPLKPLLRPFGSTTPSPTGPRTAGVIPSIGLASGKEKDVKGRNPTGTGTMKSDEKKVVGADSATTRTNLNKSQVSTGAHADASERRDSTSTEGTSGKPVLATIITEFADPTPSPLFPKDLTSLMKLSPHETRTLMEDYGLVPVRYAGTLAPREGDKTKVASSQPETEFSKEDHINRFLNHIGVCALDLSIC